jgi:hypothetical protein
MDQLRDNRQAQTGSAILSCRRTIGLRERLEDLGVSGFLNTDT